MPERLEPELIALRDRVRALVERIRSLEAGLGEDDLPGEACAEVAALSREAGVFGLTQPRMVGGIEAGPLALTVARETLAAANLRLARFALGPRAGVLEAAAGQLREEYLLPHLRGEKRGTFGFTEPDSATRPTWARQDGEELVVTGQKSFVTEARGADFVSALVNVERDAAGVGGSAMVVIDLDAPGVTFEREFRTMEGGDHAAIRFDSVRVPRWRVIGKLGEGMPRALGNISAVRLALAARACGTMQWVIEHVTAHLRAPHRSGTPLGQREGVRLRYADLRIEAYAARSTLYRTARLAESGANDVNEVMCAKVFCTEAAGRIVDGAVQLVGGRALTIGEPLERLYRQVRSMRFTEGASDVLRLNVARGRLDLDKGTV